MIGLTPRQLECWDYLRGYQAKFRMVPTYRKIMVALGLKSTENVHRLITGLEDRGYVRRTHGKPRSLELLHEDYRCPNCGWPGAGILQCQPAQNAPEPLRCEEIPHASA